MSSQFSPVVDRIRIIPRSDDFLDRNVGSSGEVFYDQQSNSLRVFSGKDRGGFTLLTSGNLSQNLIDTGISVLERAVTVGIDTVAGQASGVFYIDGVEKPVLNLVRGITYIFDQSDDTNKNYGGLYHPLMFSTTENGALVEGGGHYNVGVVYIINDDPVSMADYVSKFTSATTRKVLLTVKSVTPAQIYYWCHFHLNQGNSLKVSDPGTGSYNDLTDTPTIPADIGDLTDTGSLLFDNADAIVAITGSNLDMGSNDITTTGKIKFANVYDNLVDLPSATTYHGMFAHVHATGAAYFAHAGSWVQLANHDDLGSGGGSGDTFKTIVSDDGQVIASGESTLNILGGTNIATAIATDTSNVTISLSSFSVDFLSDVDTTTVTPTTGQVLKWDGAKWAPGTDATTGGAGTDADTLDGFDGSYYLDYNNFSNTPTVATLASFSVGNELVASGDGAISYDNSTGVFRYTPPTAAGIGALTTETNDLTSAVTWANVPDQYITQSSVTQHQTAINITSDQIIDRDDSITFVGDDSTGSSVPVGSTLQFAGAGGAGVAVSNGVVTITAGGGGGASNSFATIAADGNNIIASSATDTLTLTPGSNVTFSVDTGNKQITINSNATGGASDFDDLQDATSAGLSIDEIAEPAIAMLEVTASGTNGYRFDSHYSSLNPTIYCITGTTIAFNLNSTTMSGHPFEIQDNTGTTYNTGLVHYSTTGTKSTGSNANGKTSGTLYWHVPFGISGNWRYQCTAHSAMVGTITVKAFNAL